MLRQLRSKRVMKGLMIAIIAIVVPSFVVFYGWQSGDTQAFQPGSAAKVKLDNLGKVEIDRTDLQRAQQILLQRYRNYARVNNVPLEPQIVERLSSSEPEVVRQAIKLKILEDFAAENGIVVSEDEVVDHVRQSYPPQIRAQVQAELQRQGISVQQWLDGVQYDLLINRAHEVLANRTRVSFYEAWIEFLLRNEKLVLDFVRLNQSNYLPKVEVSEPGLQKYFEENINEFRIPDQVQYAYVLVEKDDLRSSVTVTEDEITSYYAERQEDFRLPRSAKVRQILLTEPLQADEATTEGARRQALITEARDIYQRAAKGEDFAALADQFTQEEVFPPQAVDAETTVTDEATTAGGNLGYVLESTARTFYGDEWTSTVFNMQPGAISQPFETGRGVHIVKLENIREGVVQPLEKVRGIIEERIADAKADPIFEQFGEQLSGIAETNTSLEGLARAAGLPVRQTPKVNREATVLPGIGSVGEFQEAILDLEQGGRSEVLSDNYRHLVIEVREEFPAHNPTLEEVRDQVERSYRRHKAAELAREDAEKLKKASNLEELKTAAADMGLTVTTSRAFMRPEAPAVIGQTPEFDETSREVQKGEIQVNTLGSEDEPQGYVVWHVSEKIAPPNREFAAQLPELTQELAREKAEALITEFLNDRWVQLQDRIEISPAYR